MKYAFTHGKLLDGTKDMQVQEGLCVLTDGERISAIVPEGTPLDGYTVVDLQGRYLMPGLINMHVHLAGSGKPQKKQRDSEKLVRTILSTALTRKIAYQMVCGFARTELMSGVTTIRTVGGLADFDTRLRDEIAAGRRVGPRILAANEGISVPGGHMAGSVAVAAHSIPEALAQLDAAEAQGVDLIKLMITGGVMDAKEKGVPGEMKMPPEMIKAVCDRAHAAGYRVAAHVESPQGVRAALERHGVECTLEARDATFGGSKMAERWKFIHKKNDAPLNSEAERWRKAIEEGMSILPLSDYKGEPLYKIVFIADHESDLAEAKQLYADQFVFCESKLDSLTDGFVNGELINRKFDKGTGIKAICDYLGCTLADTIGFGDSDNDLQMTDVVGISVCMANGSENLKKRCDRIAPSVYEDGIAKEFKALGLI